MNEDEHQQLLSSIITMRTLIKSMQILSNLPLLNHKQLLTICEDLMSVTTEVSRLATIANEERITTVDLFIIK